MNALRHKIRCCARSFSKVQLHRVCLVSFFAACLTLSQSGFSQNSEAPPIGTANQQLPVEVQAKLEQLQAAL
jgi:hypothetical protein